MNVNGILTNLTSPWIMGILNVTGDSFYGLSRLQTEKELIDRARQMIEEGASVLDIGALSTRPGAAPLNSEEESERISRSVAILHREFPTTLLSVDTFRSEVARCAIQEGAGIINDISGFGFDPDIVNVAAENQCPYILMHAQGTFETMHNPYLYDDITGSVIRYFLEKMEILLSAGVKDIILDPGFGFSKNVEQNHSLFADLKALHILERPILVGVSRKSMIYKKLGTSPEASLNGTTVLNTLAIERGASILRVHDVREAREILTLTGY